MQQLIQEIKTMDIYGWLLTTIGFLVISIMVGTAGIFVFADHDRGNPYIIYSIATLVTTVVMGNLGNQNLSAKETFWGWMVITFGIAAVGCIGFGVITLGRLLFA